VIAVKRLCPLAGRGSKSLPRPRPLATAWPQNTAQLLNVNVDELAGASAAALALPVADNVLRALSANVSTFRGDGV